MSQNTEQQALLRELLTSQRLAVLATQGDGKPYASLVAFAATHDLRSLFFVTLRSTRKFANLTSTPYASLLIDNRGRGRSDFHRAGAVTAEGRVTQPTEPEREAFEEAFLSLHPHLREFVTSPNCALLRVEVTCYNLVCRFQTVHEIEVIL